MSIHEENPSVCPEQEAENLPKDPLTEPGDIAEHSCEAEETPTQKKDPLAFSKAVYEYLEMFSVAICVVLLLFMFVFRLCDVRGESMEKTLFEGEKLIVSDLFYTPERNDIIIFHQTGYLNEPIVKRVIATGGEWVSLTFRDHPQSITVTIYDKNMNVKEVLDESAYAYFDTNYPLVKADFEGPIYVPEGYVFVLGDNRNHSTDSRNSAYIGLVDERRILGKVLARVYPFSKLGAVD